jgi:extracellular factor (EF) 3-hydroxypalmitic acid methyl ester biosynthesis protein
VNVVFLRNPPAEAHRNRIKHLRHRLDEEVRRVSSAGRRPRILNLGCGPAREVQLFMAENATSDAADFTLLDFNAETLEFAAQSLRRIQAEHGRHTGLEFEARSVNQLLKEAMRPPAGGHQGGYDLVYCAGLFDYVSDRVCRRLVELFYSWLAPGGLVLVTNVNAAKPFRHSMDYILEWHLICRNRLQMQGLVPDAAPASAWQISADATGVNLFLEIRKPASG